MNGFRTLGTLCALSVAAAAVTAQTLDADGDGSISLEEMLATFPATTAEDFAKIDTDADGMVSEAELAAAQEAGRIPSKG